MHTFKYIKISLATFTTLIFSGCVMTQSPAPVADGAEDVSYNSGSERKSSANSGSEHKSSAEPYNPGGSVPTPSSDGNRGYINRGENGVVGSGTYVPSYASVDVNARQHTVTRGDTVYNIALRYNISQDDLRQWNNIVNNNISVGQVLYVKNPSSSTLPAAKSAPQPSYTPPPPASVPSASSAPVIVSQGGSSDIIRTVDDISWIQPAQGQLVARFSQVTKGIEIVGTLGSPVVAVSDGKVIYSSTLEGYGNLVIIQHNTKYITAYGNNQSNLVREGAIVKRGQKIATMGKTGGVSRVQLHFELRKDGQAINPLDYIPGY